jgi:hypothetical protein
LLTSLGSFVSKESFRDINIANQLELETLTQFRQLVQNHLQTDSDNEGE